MFEDPEELKKEIWQLMLNLSVVEIEELLGEVIEKVEEIKRGYPGELDKPISEHGVDFEL